MSTPSWLGGSKKEADAAAPAAAEAEAAAAPAAASSGGQIGGLSISKADESDLPKMILFMRIANMGLAIAMITVSIITMITLPSLSTWVLSIYATCGGLLICILETQLKFLRVMVAMNFGFLFSSFWRFMFYIIMGSMAWSYGGILGKVVGISWIVVAVFNTYIIMRYPSYRKMRDQIAEEEDKRIEGRISKQVRKQAFSSIIPGRGKK